MAKPISKKVEKRIRKSAKALEKSLTSVGRASRTANAKKIAGMAVAGAAGVAAAVRYLKKGPRDGSTLHVVHDGEGWSITADGRDDAIETFATKKEAVSAARTAAAKAAPSDLVIHRTDGSVEERHSYETA